MSSLRRTLFSPGSRVLALLLALGGLGAGEAHAFVWPNVPDQIARALASGDPSERRLAAQRLVELPPEIGLKLVQQAMGDPDVEVRLHVAQAAIALRMPRAGDQVVGWLSEGDIRLRLAACDVIRASPTDRSVVALGRVLGDPDAHVRLAAAGAMGNSGLPDAVSPLLGHLDDGSPEVRVEVARALGRIGDARAVVPLIGKVQDSVSDVRRTVARALGELGDQRAGSALMLALQDGSQEVRVEAVTALGKLRSDDATPAIASLVEGEDTTEPAAPYSQGRSSGSAGAADVRAAALRALGRIGSESAVKVLLGALAKDDPAAQRSPVREALAAAGSPAAVALVTALSGSPPTNTAASAALVLGALGARDAVPAVIRAMQRGVVPLRYGLRALAEIGAPAALPTVLELLDDADPSVRKDAIRAAIALLDPAHVDGRPVDPASAALREAATPIDEKVELVRLLGRTGAPRAQAVLLPLATAKSTALRLAVIEALGALQVSGPAADDVLLKALDDESGQVRLGAAMALGRVAEPATVPVLLDRLSLSAEQDRGALGIALAGALARATAPAVAARVQATVAIAPESARDALIEGLGRMHGESAGRALAALASGPIDDRRKVAEALAGHPEMPDALRKLAADADPGVRANAVWSLGTVGKKGDLAVLTPLLKDPDSAVAGDAAAALGRIAAREAEGATVSPPLCEALADARPYVRANVLEGLSLVGADCESTPARDLLARDPAESVRLAAADHEARAAKTSEIARRALARCAGEDRSATVALRCSRPVAVAPPAAPSAAGTQAAPSPADASDDIAVFVVPDGRTSPEARAPFALVRADGLLRLGLADRRGELFELGTPRGAIRLTVPAPLVR
jgi:cellulose synthase operon protein C